MAKPRGAILVDNEKCKGCRLCVISCPTHVIGLSEEVNGKGYHFAYMNKPEACTGCNNCALICPDGVITVYRVKNKAVVE